MKLTQANVKKALQAIDITFRNTGDDFRVNLKGGTEATAYYTSDLRDALDTGRAMARERSGVPVYQQDEDVTAGDGLPFGAALPFDEASFFGLEVA